MEWSTQACVRFLFVNFSRHSKYTSSAVCKFISRLISSRLSELLMIPPIASQRQPPKNVLDKDCITLAKLIDADLNIRELLLVGAQAAQKRMDQFVDSSMDLDLRHCSARVGYAVAQIVRTYCFP